MKTATVNSIPSFLSGGGEMGVLIRSKDWSETPVGPPDSWPPSLCTTLSILLNSKFPMFLWWGPDLTCFYNDAYRPSLGQNGKHPSILGMKAENAWAEIWDIIKPLIDQVLQGGEATWSENQLVPIFRNGRIEDVYWTFSYSPVKDETGKIGGVLVVCNETTETVTTFKRQEESKQDLLNLVSHAPIGICVLDAATLVSEIVNDSFVEVAGKPYEAIAGKFYWDTFAEARPYYEAALNEVVEKGIAFYANEVELMLIRHGKEETVYVTFVYAPLKNRDGKVEKVAIWVLENTLQVVARQKIVEAEERLRLATEAGEIATFDLDLDTRKVVYSESLAKIFDMEKEKKYSQVELRDFFHPEDIENVKKSFDESILTGILNYEARLVKQNNAVTWVRTQGRVHYNEKKKPVKLIGTIRNITEEKTFTEQLEKLVQERTRELEQKNKELEKMNTELQSFAYVSSHDLQEPLRKIQTFSSRILEKETESLSDSGKDYFIRMQKAASRMQTLIEDLLSYSRTNTAERVFRNTNLDEILNEVKNDLKEALTEKHATIDADVMCNANIIPFQFSQLIQNLISNSLKFSKPGERPYIKVRSEIVKGSELKNELLLPQKTYCHITVSDNGIGFDPQYKDRIFEVFQRLHGKEEYSGTGIGLAIVKKIVENHNGIITATGELDKGTTFDVYIPA